MKRTVLNPDGVASPDSHYSHSVRVDAGDTALIFVSGQVAKTPQGEPIGKDDIVVQAEQVFQNLAAILQAHGANFEDVVRVGTFLVDGVDRKAFGSVRERYLKSPPPASTLVYVPRLVADHWLVEVEVVAAIPVSRLPT